MISSKDIIQKINNKIDAGGLTSDEILLLNSAISSLNNDTDFTSVPTITDLPDFIANTGRIYYVISEEEFFFSDGTEWLNDFDTNIYNIVAYSWGYNGARLGDNTTVNKSSPVTVVGGITNWSQISSNSFGHSLAISDGVAYAWGVNAFSALGDDTSVDKSSPVLVAGGITNWTQVSAGRLHSLGIAGGVAYGWGSNGAGKLGDNTSISGRSSPVTVAGGITNWSQISGGFSHSLGVTDTGVAYAWGSNTDGRLGDGTTINKSSPVTVVGGLTWSQVSAGGGNSLGIAGGIAYAWGIGSYGRLGDGTTVDKSSPVTVLGGITNWTQVSAGAGHGLGLTEDGIAYAWGTGLSGRLGDGTTVNKSSPITVIGGITNWSQLSASANHSLGLTNTGIAYGWGVNGYGRLGDGTTIDKSSPVTVLGATNWLQVSGGYFNSTGIASKKGFNTP